MITQEKALEYLTKNEAVCPKCGSGKIIGERFNTTGDTVFQEITCENCGEIYYDIYKLVGVGIIDPDSIIEYYADGKIERG